MTPHQYLIGVLNNQKMPTDELNTLKDLRTEIEGNLRLIYGNGPRFYYGGSYGKKTMIQAAYDLDIVMYFPSSEKRTLREMFNSVHESLGDFNYIVEPKNVALRLLYDEGFHIDIVPAKVRWFNFSRVKTLCKMRG